MITPSWSEQYSSKHQCRIDDFLTVSHSATSTAAAATWREKRSKCVQGGEGGDIEEEKKYLKPTEWIPANPIIDKATEAGGTQGEIRGECLIIGAMGRDPLSNCAKVS